MVSKSTGLAAFVRAVPDPGALLAMLRMLARGES
jgi:hypothetical protein